MNSVVYDSVKECGPSSHISGDYKICRNVTDIRYQTGQMQMQMQRNSLQ